MLVLHLIDDVVDVGASPHWRCCWCWCITSLTMLFMFVLHLINGVVDVGASPHWRCCCCWCFTSLTMLLLLVLHLIDVVVIGASPHQRYSCWWCVLRLCLTMPSIIPPNRHLIMETNSWLNNELSSVVVCRCRVIAVTLRDFTRHWYWSNIDRGDESESDVLCINYIDIFYSQ